MNNNLLDKDSLTTCLRVSRTSGRYTYANITPVSRQKPDPRDTFLKISNKFSQPTMSDENKAILNGGPIGIPLTEQDVFVCSHSPNLPDYLWWNHFDHSTNDPEWMELYKSKVPTSYPAFPIRKFRGIIRKMMLVTTESTDGFSANLAKTIQFRNIHMAIPNIELQIEFSNKTITYTMHGCCFPQPNTSAHLKRVGGTSTDPNVPTDSDGYIIDRYSEQCHYLRSSANTYEYGGLNATYDFQSVYDYQGGWDASDEDTWRAGTHICLRPNIEFDFVDIVATYLGNTGIDGDDPTGLGSLRNYKNLDPLRNNISKPTGKLNVSNIVLPTIGELVRDLGKSNEVDLNEMVTLRMRINAPSIGHGDNGNYGCILHDGFGDITYVDDIPSGSLLLNNSLVISAMDIQYRGYAGNVCGCVPFEDDIEPPTNSVGNGSEYYSMYDCRMFTQFRSAYDSSQYPVEWKRQPDIYVPNIRIFR